MARIHRLKKRSLNRCKFIDKTKKRIKIRNDDRSKNFRSKKYREILFFMLIIGKKNAVFHTL